MVQAANRTLDERKVRSRRWSLAAGLLVALLFASGSWWFFSRQRGAVDPPPFPVTDGDPLVVQAIQSASREVRRNRKSAGAWGRLGMTFLAHGLHDQANTCFVQAEKFAPKEARWPYFQGIAYLDNEPETAIAKLEKAVALCDPTLTVPRLRLAETLESRERYEPAADQFRRILLVEPDNPRAHLGIGRISFVRGNFIDSEEHLARSSAHPFTRKASVVNLNELQRRLGRPVAALRNHLLPTELPEDPVWPDPFMEEVEQLETGKQACLARADRLLRKGRVRDAVNLYQQNLIIYPEWDWGWLGVGRALIQANDFNAAERALRTALRLKSGSVEAHFYLAVALFEQNRIDPAAEEFRTALALKPDYAVAHYNLAHCLIRQQNTKEAIAVLRQAVLSKPHYAEAHRSLGALLGQEGQYGEALTHLSIASELNPNDDRARKLLTGMEERSSAQKPKNSH